MNKEDNPNSRREFLTRVSAAAAMGLIGSLGLKGASVGAEAEKVVQTGPAMPSITLGKHKISRIICGSNPLLGYSYMGHHTDRHMKDYFTTENTVEFLLKCEQAGITTHQFSTRLDYFPLLRDRGSKMKIICLHSQADNLSETIEVARPIAIVHHGGVTDRLFAEGKSGVVHDFVKTVKDKGLLAGVSAHNPDNIKKIADEGWDVDLFMTCFYYLTRKINKDDPNQILPAGSYNFYKDDPKAMTQVIRQVKQPCLAFKILGAGRLTSTQERVKSAFQFAFENIKPIDGVIIGMFPWYFDEIGANSGYVRELGKIG
jgi:hypothetical protein